MSQEFDFAQPPRAPVILPIKPRTDMIAPRPAVTPATPAAVRRLVLRAISRYLGIRPRQLRAALASGLTLRDVARSRGKTVAGLRRAVERELHAQVAQLVP